MLHIKKFIFNPVCVNTYLVSNDEGKCVIVDCGCWEDGEWNELKGYINSNNLVPIHLLNTHFHLDHVFGNKYVIQDYGLKPLGSPLDYPIYDTLHSQVSMFFGKRIADSLDYSYSKERGPGLADGQIIKIGNDELHVLLTPGHSPGGVCFYSPSDQFLLSGDTLFHGSIGRTDLAGGDYNTLLRSIREKLYVLPEATVVYPGHDSTTTIGQEKAYNPFTN